HAPHHVLRENAGCGEAEKDVGAVDHLLELARGRRLDIARLARGHLLGSTLIDHAEAIDEDDVLRLEPHADEEVEAGEPGGPSPRRDELDLLDPLADDAQAVLHGGAYDDRRAVLIVVEDRDAHARAQRLLDLEALGCLDVLEI